VSVEAFCNYYYHIIKIEPAVKFNLQRYPNGAYVQVRFASSSWNGNAWENWSFTPWVVKGVVQPIIRTVFNYSNPGLEYAAQLWRPLDGSEYRYPKAEGGPIEYYLLGAQVAVWNGAGYEIEGAVARGYTEQGKAWISTGLGSSGTFCGA